MSKKFALAAGAVALCAMTAASNAQVQMQRDITWKLGLAIAEGAIEECAKNNVAITVAVVDRAGRVRIFIASDNPSPHNFELARRKAYTARTFRAPSADFLKRMQRDPAAHASEEYTRVLALPGGLPIKVGDDVVGAVGVSGSPGKDDDCGQAGINKVADQLK